MNSKSYLQKIFTPLVIFLLFGLSFVPLHAFQEDRSPTLFFIIRHVEKQAEKDDPGLSPEGIKRAEMYAKVFEHEHFSAILVTQYKRTLETALPIAKTFGISPVTVRIEPQKMESHIADLLSIVYREHKGEKVLVISHSNVIPKLLQSLGCDGEIEIKDEEYYNLFIVTVTNEGNVSCVRLRLDSH